MKKSKTIKQQTESVLYYSLRISQRVSLFLTAMLTALLWMWMISVSTNLSFINLITEKTVKDSTAEELNAIVQGSIDRLSSGALTWAAVGIALTVILALLPRVRKYEKRLVVDSLIYFSLLVVSVIFSQSLLRAFLATF